MMIPHSSHRGPPPSERGLAAAGAPERAVGRTEDGVEGATRRSGGLLGPVGGATADGAGFGRETGVQRCSRTGPASPGRAPLSRTGCPCWFLSTIHRLGGFGDVSSRTISPTSVRGVGSHFTVRFATRWISTIRPHPMQGSNFIRPSPWDRPLVSGHHPPFHWGGGSGVRTSRKGGLRVSVGWPSQVRRVATRVSEGVL